MGELSKEPADWTGRPVVHIFLTHSESEASGKIRSENTKAMVMRQSGKPREFHWGVPHKPHVDDNRRWNSSHVVFAMDQRISDPGVSESFHDSTKSQCSH